MKRTIFASLAASSLIFVAPQAKAWEPNWLIGGSIGYGESNANLNSNIDYLNPAGIATQLVNATQETSFHNNGGLAGLFLGYQATCNNWLAGLELSADWYKDYKTQNFALVAGPQPGFGASLGYQGSANYKQDVTLGLTARFGYAVSEFLIPYIRLGAEVNRNRLDVNYVSPTGFNAGNTAFAGNVSVANTNYRFVGGIGVELPLCSLICADNYIHGPSLRAEYNYQGRNRTLNGQTLSLDSLNAPALSDQLYSASYRPECNVGKISLVWNFS